MTAVSDRAWPARTEVECEVCGRTTTATPTGLVRAHRSVRVDRHGVEYVADDRCPGGGEIIRLKRYE